MDIADYIWIFVGGAVGAVCRHWVAKSMEKVKPWGTFTVNCAGSFLIVIAVSFPGGFEVQKLAFATGFCGALTTFSSFVLDAAVLWAQGFRRKSIGYAAVTLLSCLGSILLARIFISLFIR